MDGATPVELNGLLHASDPAVREAAWTRLVERHTRLLLAVARSFGGGHDEVMERYTYILERLAESNHRRLRAYQADGRARFSTWLTIAARRLCLDFLRIRYGRSRPTRDPDQATALRRARRNLADSLGADIDTDLLPDADAASAEAVTIRAERDARLRAAVAALPASDRLLITLRFEDDLPASRIAGVAGYPTPFHVYRRLNAVLASLRATLESHGLDDSAG